MIIPIVLLIKKKTLNFKRIRDGSNYSTERPFPFRLNGNSLDNKSQVPSKTYNLRIIQVSTEKLSFRISILKETSK